MGLPYPGGHAMDILATQGEPNAIKFPSPAIHGDSLDFSFSGLKTAVINYLNTKNQKGEEINKADVISPILQMRKLDPSEVSFGQRPANRLNSKAWVSSQVSAPRSPHL